MRAMKRWLVAASAGFVVCGGHPAAALVIRVPADQPTIQQGIDAAVDGDTVLVTPGVYSETLDFHGKAITVASESGRDATVIDGHGAAPVATFASGEGRTSVLAGFTLRGGRASYDTPTFAGGGVRIDRA